MFWRRSSPRSFSEPVREIEADALRETLGETLASAAMSASEAAPSPAEADEVEWIPVVPDPPPAAQNAEAEAEAVAEPAPPLAATETTTEASPAPPLCEQRVTWYGPYGINDDGPSGIAAGVYVIAGRAAGSRLPSFQYDSVQRVEMRSADVVREAFRRAKGDCEILIPASVRVWIGVPESESETPADLLNVRQAVAFALQPQLSENVGAAAAPAQDMVLRNSCASPPGRLDPVARAFWPEIIAYAAAPEPKITLRWAQQDDYLSWCRLAREVHVKPDPAPTAVVRWLPAGLFVAALAFIGALVGFGSSPGGTVAAPNGTSTIEHQLRDGLDQLSRDLQTAKDQIARLLQEKSQFAQQVQLLSDQLRTAAAQLAEKDNQLNVMQARLPLDMAPSRSTSASPSVGLEVQSCWQREGRRTVPVYHVEIRDSDFVVSPAWKAVAEGWPSEFAPAMKDFTAAPVAEPTILDAGAFAGRMRPYYDFGKSEANCRFFVDVSDSTSNKESWKAGLELVERFFYKRLV